MSSFPLLDSSLLQTNYHTVMPLYFPRNGEEEAYAAKALPQDLGDEFGEPIIQERKIRIAVNPLVKGRERERVCVCFKKNVCVCLCVCRGLAGE